MLDLLKEAIKILNISFFEYIRPQNKNGDYSIKNKFGNEFHIAGYALKPQTADQFLEKVICF